MYVDIEDQEGRYSRVLWLPNLPKFVLSGGVTVIVARLLVLVF
jgi:hypothetical protein